MCTKLAINGFSHRLAAVGFQARASAVYPELEKRMAGGREAVHFAWTGRRAGPASRPTGHPMAAQGAHSSGTVQRHSKVNNAFRGLSRWQAHRTSSAGEHVTQPSVECPSSSVSRTN